MKMSFYTSVSQRGDEAILFNACTGTALLVGSDALEEVRPYLCRSGGSGGKVKLGDADSEPRIEPESSPVQDMDSELADLLVGLGFFVDEDVDERAIEHARFVRAQHDPGVKRLCIAPTYACNLRCPYCYESESRTDGRKMTPQVMDAICSFVAGRFEKMPFHSLSVEWYGGDLSLALGCVEYLSERLLSWCESNGILYDSVMLSNVTRLTRDDAETLRRCHVDNMLITVDGPHALHNLRRPRADGADSFDATLEAIGYLLDAGIEVSISTNVDKVSARYFARFSEEMESRFGIKPKAVKLNDYCSTFGCADFCGPAFDLFDHVGFARYDFEQFAESAPGALNIAARLAPAPLFCSAQSVNSFVIDPEGDMFKCDGRMGDSAHRLLNILDMDEGADILDEVAPYPYGDAKCEECRILPICNGNCEWERQCCGWPCHPLKETLDDYLWLLRSRFECDLSEQPYCILSPQNA